MNQEFYFFGDTPQLQEVENKKRLVGYGIKWDVLSHDLGGFRMVFRKGSIDLSAPADGFEDFKFFYQHDHQNGYLARTSNGTFRLEDDGVGIKYSVDLPDTQLGKDVAYLAGRGDLKGASVGILDPEVNWKKEKEGMPIREVYSTKLYEISAVYDPAFPMTSNRLEAASIELLKFLSTPRRDWAIRDLQLQKLQIAG
jgi:HK97 family phage prohead protease